MLNDSFKEIYSQDGSLNCLSGDYKSLEWHKLTRRWAVTPLFTAAFVCCAFYSRTAWMPPEEQEDKQRWTNVGISFSYSLPHFFIV